jgi:nucleotide-binding universal stress UspA family protein
MSAVTRILVGTDLSVGSQAAVDRAVQLAATHGAALCIIHVRPLAVESSPSDASKDERVRQRLADLAASLNERAGIDATACVETGSPADVINAYAKANASSLVVVGSRADATISGLGSTASKVVRTPTCPVLTVRAAGSRQYERIVLATDMREGADRATSFALTLFPSAHHHLLYALDPCADGDSSTENVPTDQLSAGRQRLYMRARAELRNLAKRLSAMALHPLIADVAEDVPARAVLVYAADLPADCVVVGHHAGAPDPGYILGSLAQHVIYSSICDVLVVP